VSSHKVYVADCAWLGAPEATEIASTFEIGRYADNSTQRLPRCSARPFLNRTSDRIVSYDNHVATKGRRGFDWKKRSQKHECR